MNKLTAILAIFLMPIFSGLSSASSVSSIHIAYTEKELQSVNDPQAFATILYALITADAERSNENRLKFPTLFFTPVLLKQYKEIADRDLRTKEVGCLNDFNNFTGAQESSNGFWIGKVIVENSSLLVPVYFNFGNVLDIKKPNLTLRLIKTDKGLKIADIDYLNQDKSTLRSVMKSCLAHSAQS